MDLTQWVGENWGFLAVIVFVLVMNVDKLLAFAAKLLPDFRAGYEKEQELEEAAVHHQLARMASEVQADLERERESFALIVKTMEWMREDGKDTTRQMANLAERLTSLLHVYNRQGDKLIVLAHEIAKQHDLIVRILDRLDIPTEVD